MTAFSIWLTGLPGSGKTTIAEALSHYLTPSFILDGDDIRRWLTPDLGFSREDRFQNLLRVAHVANAILHVGGIPIIALVSPHQQERNQAIATLSSQCVLVHLDCPLAVCEQRDPKGLYARARAGEIKGLTGLDGEYEKPDRPDVYVRTDLTTIQSAVDTILSRTGKPRS